MPTSQKPISYREWAQDVLATPEADRLTFIRESLRSKRMLHIFGRYFFPHIIKGDYDTPEAHMALIKELASPRTSAIIFPRGFAKTSWEKIDTLHDVVYALEPLIVFVGSTATDVDFHFSAIRSELENNSDLRAVYGDLTPDKQGDAKWNSAHVRTRNGIDLIGRGYGKGRGVNIEGRRPSKIVIDDGETDEMVRSEVRREKCWRWLIEVIEPSLDKEKGRVKMIGTVISPRCAVKRFYEERGGMLRRAIEDGKSIWPEYWTLEDLFRKRDGFIDEDGKRVLGIGSRAFSQEYLNEPLGDGITMFKREHLDSNTYETVPPRPELRVVMATDPAAGEGSLADDYGTTVMALHKPTGIRYVLQSEKFHGSVTAALAWWESIYRAWEPEIAGIEGSMTVQAFWQLIRDKGTYRVRKLLPSLGMGGRAAPKDERAKLLLPHVEGGRVKFHPKHHDLYDQMLAFPSPDVHDDVFDSFMYANSLLDDGSGMIALRPTRTITGTSNIMSRKF
jgi:hypothetical protein